MAAIGLHIKIPKQSLINLKDYANRKIIVKFNGGRLVEGTLKSWDKGLNMILDNALQIKYLGPKLSSTRQLGMIIIKGSQLYSITAKDGYMQIDNPFEKVLGQNE